MRNRSAIRRAFGVLAAASMLAVMAPTAAQADTCSGYWGFYPITVGAGGRDLASTPEAHVEVCIVANGDPTQAVPTPRVNLEYGWSLMLDHAYGSPSQFGVSYRYSVDGSQSSWSAVVPVGGGSGSSTCVFFFGYSGYNPGNCLAYINT